MRFFTSRLAIFITIGIALLGTISILLFLNPKIQTTTLVNDSVEIPTIINSKSQNSTIWFQEPHEVWINEKLVTTSRIYSIDKKVLKEGENSLRFRKVRDFKLVTLQSEQLANHTITLDTTPPKLSLKSTIPEFLLLEKELKINLQSDSKGKIKIDSKEIEVEANTQKSVSIPVIDGKNTLTIVAEDEHGNQSLPLTREFAALKRPGWEKYQCKDVILPINRNRLQRGYSDIEFYGTPAFGPARTQATSDQLAFLQSTQRGDCKVPGVYSGIYSLDIVPKNTKFPCYPCDLWAMQYLRLEIFPQSMSGKPIIKRLAASTLKKEFTTKSGVKGAMYEHNIPPIELASGTLPPNFIRDFEFSKNGFIYRLSAIKVGGKAIKIPFYNNLEQDFEEIVNNFVVL